MESFEETSRFSDVSKMFSSWTSAREKCLHYILKLEMRSLYINVTIINYLSSIIFKLYF